MLNGPVACILSIMLEGTLSMYLLDKLRMKERYDCLWGEYGPQLVAIIGHQKAATLSQLSTIVELPERVSLQSV